MTVFLLWHEREKSRHLSGFFLISQITFKSVLYLFGGNLFSKQFEVWLSVPLSQIKAALEATDAQTIAYPLNQM